MISVPLPSKAQFCFFWSDRFNTCALPVPSEELYWHKSADVRQCLCPHLPKEQHEGPSTKEANMSIIPWTLIANTLVSYVLLHTCLSACICSHTPDFLLPPKEQTPLLPSQWFPSVKKHSYFSHASHLSFLSHLVSHCLFHTAGSLAWAKLQTWPTSHLHDSWLEGRGLHPKITQVSWCLVLSRTLEFGT